MVGDNRLRGAGAAAATHRRLCPPSPHAREAEPRSLWDEDRSRTGEYGATVLAPSTPARAARSALVVDTLVNSPG
jgi:hypothetical protein